MTQVLKSRGTLLFNLVLVPRGKKSTVVLSRKYATLPVENMVGRPLTPAGEKWSKNDNHGERYKRLPNNTYRRQCFEKLIIEKHEELNNLNWPKLQSETMKVMKHLNEESFQNILMEYFALNNQFDRAKKYMNYLEKSSRPNFMTLAHYISLCGKNNDENELFKKLEKIPKEYYIINDLSNRIVSGLCQTSRWRDCLSILRQREKFREAKCNNQWGKVAQTAFKNQDIMLGIELLEEMHNDNLILYPTIINEWVHLICQLPASEKASKLSTFLNFSKAKELSLQLEAIENLKETFEKDLKMRSQLVQVKRDDTHCPACNMKLETLQITDEEFKNLREEMLKVLINGEDIYQNSNPKEVDNFMKFLERARPYNLVIDALNVAFIKPYDKQNMLLDVVRYLKRNMKNPRILLIGRKHMTKWRALKEIGRTEQVFLTDNISEDDPFMLYSTIARGPGTFFLSVDMMRNHSFKFSKNESLKILFNKWKKSHQILLEKDNENLTFVKPSSIETRCQGGLDFGHVHVPSSEMDLTTFSRTWLCVKT